MASADVEVDERHSGSEAIIGEDEYPACSPVEFRSGSSAVLDALPRQSRGVAIKGGACELWT